MITKVYANRRAGLRAGEFATLLRRTVIMPKIKLVGWGLSFVLVAFLIFASAAGKFTEWEGKEKMLEHIGFPASTVRNIGFVEVAIAILFLVPQCAFLGAVLLTGYLGGATATHVRIGEPYVMPIIFGVIVWITLGFRDPRIFTLAFPYFFRK
jgi:DoxX-like family